MLPASDAPASADMAAASGTFSPMDHSLSPQNWGNTSKRPDELSSLPLGFSLK